MTKWRIHWIDKRTGQPDHQVGPRCLFDEKSKADAAIAGFNLDWCDGRDHWSQPEDVEVPEPKLDPKPFVVASTSEVKSLIAELRSEFDAKIAAIKPKPELWRVWCRAKINRGQRMKDYDVGDRDDMVARVIRLNEQWPLLTHWIEPEVAE